MVFQNTLIELGLKFENTSVSNVKTTTTKITTNFKFSRLKSSTIFFKQNFKLIILLYLLFSSMLMIIDWERLRWNNRFYVMKNANLRFCRQFWKSEGSPNAGKLLHTSIQRHYYYDYKASAVLNNKIFLCLLQNDVC